MPTYEMPKVCANNHAPMYLKRMTCINRGFTEPVCIGDCEAWICPVCNAVYAFEKEDDE